MDDIFETETETNASPANDMRLFFREIIRDELKKREKKQKKKKGQKKSKKKKEKTKKVSQWEILAIKSAHVVIEQGIPALFRKLATCGQEKAIGKGK